MDIRLSQQSLAELSLFLNYCKQDRLRIIVCYNTYGTKLLRFIELLKIIKPPYAVRITSYKLTVNTG